jgi:hypothetical protein
LHSPCLITTLIAFISAQAGTPVVSSRKWQIPTRSPRVRVTRTRAGTPLRARRISGHDTQHLHAFLRRAHVHVGGPHVARRLRAARLAIHPSFVPPHPDASTGASNVSLLLAVPGQAHLPVNLDHSPVLAHALSVRDLSPPPALRATALSTFLPWPCSCPGPGPGAKFVLSTSAKLAGTPACRPSMDRGSRDYLLRGYLRGRCGGGLDQVRTHRQRAYAGRARIRTCSCLGLQRIGRAAALRPRRCISRMLPPHDLRGRLRRDSRAPSLLRAAVNTGARRCRARFHTWRFAHRRRAPTSSARSCTTGAGSAGRSQRSDKAPVAVELGGICAYAWMVLQALDISTHWCRRIRHCPVFFSVALGARSASLLAHEESRVRYYILLHFRSNVLSEV